MIYPIDRLARMVRMRLGLDANPKPLIDMAPQALSVHQRISVVIPAAVRAVLARTDPAVLCGSGHDFGDTDIYWHDMPGDYVGGHVLLPPDFMRLLCFAMSDWHVDVTESDIIDDIAAYRMNDRHGGISGSPMRPMARIAILTEGRALVFRGCRSTAATITRAAYYPLPKIDCHGGIEFPSPCLDAVIDTAVDLYLNLSNKNTDPK